MGAARTHRVLAVLDANGAIRKGWNAMLRRARARGRTDGWRAASSGAQRPQPNVILDDSRTDPGR